MIEVGMANDYINLRYLVWKYSIDTESGGWRYTGFSVDKPYGAQYYKEYFPSLVKASHTTQEFIEHINPKYKELLMAVVAELDMQQIGQK